MEARTLTLSQPTPLDAAPRQASFSLRYAVKLGKSVADAAINVVMLLFVPRVLGPSGYGSFNFIRETFQNVIAFADLSLSSAHINYASRKGGSRAATDVYFSYMLLIGVLVTAFVAGITAAGFERYMFPGQHPSFVMMGALLAYLMYLQVALVGLSDSKLATVGFEIRSVIVNVVMFVPLLALFWSGTLELTSFFVLRIALYAALLGVGAHYLFRAIGFRPSFPNLRDPHTREIIRTFVSFSHPLVTLSVLGVLFAYFDRWFLQVIYGSVSQGYYSLAFSLSSIAGLFLAPMTPLLMQTVAKSDESNDPGAVRAAFRRVELLYVLSAFVSVFFMFHTREIVRLIGGDDYDGAGPTIAVMFLYPLHVVYGQFCGATLIALRKTALYRNIALASAIAGVALSYMLLAPRSFAVPGLELNSLGLALKVVLVQLATVTTQLYFICRHVDDRMSRFVSSQIMTLVPLVALGIAEWLIRRQMGYQPADVAGSLLSVVVSLALWGVVMAAVVWRFPGVAGLERAFVRNSARQAYATLRGRLNGSGSSRER